MWWLLIPEIVISILEILFSNTNSKSKGKRKNGKAYDKNKRYQG